MAYINKNVSTMAMPSGMSRMGQFPLDMSSVFYSESELRAYATSGAIAYVGQIISLVDEVNNKVTVYSIQNKAGDLKEISTMPMGDNKTIEVSAEGAIALLGAKDAANGTLPIVGEDGKLTWRTLEDIGAGDGNDNTTYEFSFAEQKITIKPLFNGLPIKVKNDQGEDTEEIVTHVLDLSSFVTADEVPVYGVKEGDKALKLNGTEFSTELGLTYANNRISLTGIDGAEIAGFDASRFVEDGFLQDVSYNAATRELTFTWNIVVSAEGENIVYKTDVINIADLVDTYTAGNGLKLTDGKFAIKLAGGTEGFLTADATGLKLTGVQEAINNAKQAAIDDAAGKYLTTNEVYLKTEVYTKDEVTQTINTATGGVSGSEVRDTLNEYKKTVNTEIWGNENGSGDSRIDTIETKVSGIAEGAQVNVIEKIELEDALNSRLTISAVANKTVKIDDSGLRADIANAKKAGDDAALIANGAVNAASQNATAIQTNIADIGGLKTLTGEHANKIAALEQADATHSGEFNALNGTVNTHGEKIAALETGKADKTTTDALSARITTNEAALKTLNETTIPGINSDIAKKADADKIYTKTEIGTIAENKTLVDMINEAKSEATYDDTKVKADIKANTDAISAIYKVEGTVKSGVLATEIARVEGLVSTEAGRAQGAEALLASRLDTVEAFWKEAIRDGDEKNVIDTLREIQDYIEGDHTGAAEMAASIKSNTDAISAIYSVVDGTESGILVTKLTQVNNAIAAINNVDTGILAQAKKHTNDAIAALPIKGVDDKTIKLNSEGKAHVAEVPTDSLVQGELELIFYAGNASGYITNI